MDGDRFTGDLAEILGVSQTEISLTTELESLKEWDSLTVLSFMVYIDEKCGHLVSPDDIAAARTVGDLYELTH